ncbi:MAG: glycoside hydrolase family 2 TIM barrel-domain containing protein [Breznakibacter sp.]
MLKHLIYIIMLCTGLSACCNAPTLAKTENFDYGWQFYRSDDTLAFPSGNTDWETVDLPHTARIEPLTVNDQWQGICFYQKSFSLPENFRDKVVSLQFDAAMNVAEVWVNGQKLAHHLGGYLPFVVNLDGVARFDTLNTVLVRLDNRDNPITGPKPLEILDFNMYGGLYRHVHLIARNKIHLTNPMEVDVVAGGGVFFATTKADKQQATVEVKSHVQNQTDAPATIHVTHTLTDASGKVVATFQSDKNTVESGQAKELIVNGTVNAPQLWSPATPHVYTLKTEIYANDRLTDAQTDRVGIRTVQITPEGLWLNGEKTFLRGVNRHQEYPYVGYAMSDAAQYRDAYRIKQAGFDFVRSSHYPMSPAFLDACDELGIMVLDAILGWQYFGDQEFEKLALRSSRELIRRDRNHPSILAWELSINETSMPQSFTSMAHRIAHEEFPYNGTYSAGWVRQSYDIYIEARQHRHGLYPEKPLLVSEYGDWEYYAQNAGFNQEDWKDLLEEERNSRQPRFAGEKRMLQQALNLQEAHNDNLSTHAFADGYWVMFDYNRGMAPDHEYSGVMDIFRLPKFSYYFFKSQRSISGSDTFAEPVVFIASHWLPGVSDGIKVFSNCDEVELSIDGQAAIRQKPDQNALTTNLQHPPFTFNVGCKAAGTVKAVGYIQGKAVKEHVVSTPLSPARLVLQADESGKPPATNDVVFVYAQVADANGTTACRDNRDVTFNVSGAQLVSPVTVKAEAGIATAVVRTPKAPSQISVTASAEGIETGTVLIKTKQ